MLVGVLVGAGDASPVDHRFGSVFILFGEDDVVATGVGSRLPEPCLCIATADLVCVCSGWYWCCSVSRGFCLSEPGRVTFVSGTGVPWNATSALPESDTFLSSTCFAPGSLV